MGIFGRKDKDLSSPSEEWADIFANLRTGVVDCRDWTSEQPYPTIDPLLEEIYLSERNDNPNIDFIRLAAGFVNMVELISRTYAEQLDGNQTHVRGMPNGPSATKVFRASLVDDMFAAICVRDDFQIDMLLNGLTHLGTMGIAIARKIIANNGEMDVELFLRMLREGAASGALDHN